MAVVSIELVVTHPFGAHQIGDVISDEKEVAAVLADYPSCVTKRAAAPATTTAAAD